MPTPSSGGLAAVWCFGRRQYQIIHTYRPGLWWLAFGTLSTRLAAWGLLLAHPDQPAAGMALAALIAIAFAGFVVQARVARRLGFSDSTGARFAQGLMAVLKPVVDLFHWSLVLAAAVTGSIRWGHVTYRVLGPSNISIRSREPWV